MAWAIEFRTFGAHAANPKPQAREDQTIRLCDTLDPLAMLTPSERILELEVRSAMTLDANLKLRTLSFAEWQAKVQSPEYRTIEQKLAARSAKPAPPLVPPTAAAPPEPKSATTPEPATAHTTASWPLFAVLAYVGLIALLALSRKTIG